MRHSVALLLVLQLLLLLEAVLGDNPTILPSANIVGPVTDRMNCVLHNLLTTFCSMAVCPADTYMASSALRYVWGITYSFTAPVSGVYTFSTANPAATCIDTYLAVQLGGNTATKVCNNDISATDKASALNFALLQGQTANILVAENAGECSGQWITSLEIRLITVAPTLSPTTSLPTLAPTTSLPTLAPTTSLPTQSPSKAPTTSKPTQSPSKAPTTSLPTQSPSKNPTTSKPTQSPTASPTTSRPTMAPTTSLPTTAPTTSQPTTSPTHSPTFYCRPGTYSESGYGSSADDCVLCPAGTYDTAEAGAPGLRLTCANNQACALDFWCGAGAVLGETYVRVVSHPDVTESVVVASTRQLEVEFTKLVGQGLELRVFTNEDAIQLALPELSVPASASTFVVSFIVDANKLRSAAGDDTNEYLLHVHVEGKYAGESAYTFRSDVSVDIQLVSVVINPSEFAYSLLIGEEYSASLALRPVAEILNPLCSDTLVYNASVEAGSQLLRVEAATLLDAELPPGFGSSFAFAVDLTQVAPSTDFSRGARLLRTHVAFRMRLWPMDITFERFVNVSVRVLELCPPGTTSLSGTNEVGCTPCEDGTYQPSHGTARCFPVGPGQEVNAARTDAVQCRVGTFSSAQTQLCVACPRGTYAAAAGSSFCQACPAGTFPTTLHEGAASPEDCTTDELQGGFKNADGRFQLCPAGTTCDFDGATVATLKVNPGFFRTSNASLDVRACRPQHCEPAEPTRRALAAYDPARYTEYCSPNHQGHMCETCRAGFTRRGEFGTCQLCDAGTSSADAARAAGGLVALVVAALALSLGMVLRSYVFWRPKPFILEEQPHEAPRRSHFRRLGGLLDRLDAGSTPLKITIGYFQVVAGMALALGDYLPAYFASIAQFFSLLSLDLVRIFNFGCALPSQGHFSSLLFATLLPLGFFAVLLAAERAAARVVEHTQALHVGFMNLYLWVLFLIYPSTAKTIFETFSCTEFDDGLAFVRADLAVDCASEAYRGMVAYGVAAVLVYVLGVPVLFYRLLDRQRFQLNACPEFEQGISLAYREKNIQVQGTRLLWSGYAPSRYNFEVFELCRKLFQTSLFVFVSQDSAAQVVSLLVVCAVVIVVMGWSNPYVKKVHTGLAQWAQWNIFAIAFVALLNRVGATSSAERAAVYVLLLLCLVSVPLMALVILLRAAKPSQYASKALSKVLEQDSPSVGLMPASSLDRGRAVVKSRLDRLQSQRKRGDDYANSGITELQRIVSELRSVDELARHRLLSSLNVLIKTLAQEAEVAKLEHNMLKNRESETDKLRNKIAQLAEENEGLVLATMMAEDNLVEKQEYYREEIDRIAAEQKEREGQGDEEMAATQVARKSGRLTGGLKRAAAVGKRSPKSPRLGL
ncbi:hypothetical protein BASA81_008457 [Batrachochytrium salamandrivorans]|nr:hypothetical protein BASA81_008457 [Batrachochytrium salamandrivorans]